MILDSGRHFWLNVYVKKKITHRLSCWLIGERTRRFLKLEDFRFIQMRSWELYVQKYFMLFSCCFHRFLNWYEADADFILFFKFSYINAQVEDYFCSLPLNKTHFFTNALIYCPLPDFPAEWTPVLIFNLFFTPELSEVIIIFSSVVPHCRQICSDPVHCSDTFSLVYDAKKQRSILVWTVFFTSGASLDNRRLVFACREGTPVCRRLLFAIRGSHWGLQQQPRCAEFLHKQFNINNATLDGVSVESLPTRGIW